jgi:regulator of RNase E activity RraA
MDIVSIGEPIHIDGVAAEVGDYIIGDVDGLAVIPREIAPDTIRLAKEKVSGEGRVRAELARGRPIGEVFRRHGIL